MADQVAGTVLIERYALEDRIGVGGMASVYRAIDLTTGSRVAVKILSRDFLAKNPKEAERNVKRFQREAEILQLLSGDPYVVQYLEHGVSPAGDHFIAMELLVGEQLRFYIGRGKTAMGLRTFAYYARHLVLGLKGIHEKGVIHRDLAPDNVVVVKTREGLPWPKFLDFGIGKAVDGGVEKLTQMLTIMGKPQYFSPEQARGQELTARSDVYALGVVLYEMTTGHVPIDVHVIADLRKIQKAPPMPITSYREGARIPEELRSVIMRCLEKEPEARPTLDEVLGVLDRFSARLEAGEEFPLPPDDLGDSTSRAVAAAEGTPAPGTPAAPAKTEFEQGETIGRFQVRERIGRGGMGLVYLAWDPILLRDVAIKVATRVEEEKARRAILREARASSHLKSENIVTIYDAGTEAGSPYIAMEYVRGKTLAQIIEEEGPLAGERFWSLARGILDGLIYAHSGDKPVIHRDLKPSNILCSGEVAKITDFGIATVTAAQQLTLAARESHTGGAGGGTEGSVFTMSPEQANNKPADHRSDIYSLGCVLYMMVTGRAPFLGNQIAVLYQHVTRPPEPPVRVNPNLSPAALNGVILKCLEKDPANRYQSVRDVKADLERIFGTVVEARPWHRSPLVLASLGAIALTGLAISFALLRSTGPKLAKVFTLTRVAGTPVHPDRPQDGFFTKSRDLDLEVATREAGELRATVSADWLPAPHVHVSQLVPNQTTLVRIPLPAAAELEPAKFTVKLERSDNPALEPKTLTIWQDLREPRVKFRAYGVSHDPSTTPLRVVRIDDLTAVVEDPGGFDDEGTVQKVEVAWNEHKHQVRFERKRREGVPDVTWTATVTAQDRAGNKNPDVGQSVEIADVDIAFLRPTEGSAINTRAFRFEVTARLKDRSRPIAGLDENDLELGEGALVARITAGSRTLPLVKMSRVTGGYAADLELPADMPPECDFDLDVLFEGDVEKQSRHRFDSVPPDLWVTWGGVVVASTASDVESRAIPLEGPASRGGHYACRIEDGGGVAGSTVTVQVGQAAPVPVAVLEDGSFALPPLGAQETVVHIVGRDRAGNQSVLEVPVAPRGGRVASLRISGRAPDAEGRVFVKDARVPLRFSGVGIPESRHAFAVVLDENGREQESVTLDRAPGETDVFETSGIGLFPEGAGAARRTLRILAGETRADARPLTRDVEVIYDGEAPAISVTAEGSDEEVRGSRTVGRFPSLRVKISDNVALLGRPIQQILSWSRTDQSGADVVLVPGRTVLSPDSLPASVTFSIERPPGPPAANRFEFKIEPRDRAEGVAVRQFTIVVVPSDVAIVAIADRTGLSEFGQSAEKPLILGRDDVTVSVRPPKPPATPCTLLVKIFPDGGPEVVRRFPLDDPEGIRRVDLRLQLPPASDGRLIQRGRMVFLVEESGSARPDELLSVYYLLDRAPPSWEITRNAKLLTEAERLDWIKVPALSSVRIVVTDGSGSGFDDDSIEDPRRVIGAVEERTQDRIVFSLRDDEAFRGLAMEEIDLRVRDAAGNVTPIRLRLAHSTELLRVQRLLTADGGEPLTRDDLVVVAAPELRFVVDHEAVGYEGVRWSVKRGDREIGSGVLKLEEGKVPEPGSIQWKAAEGAEAYVIEFHADESKRGLQKEPFHSVRVLVDTAPPAIHLWAGANPIARGERAQVKDFEELRLSVTDLGADFLPSATSVVIAGTGEPVPAALAASRDGTQLRIMPSQKLADGVYTVRVTAADRLGNVDTKTFEVELTPTAVPPPPKGHSRPSSRPATRPESERTVANQAVRTKDEDRTGIKLAPVWDSPDRSGQPRFFMSQTEVTNEQFLRFVDAVVKDQVPKELRWHQDLSSLRKRIENMRSRFDDFRRDPQLPVVDVEPEVALAYAAWTGGRLPSREEWAGAAGRFLLKNAEYPVYLDHGTPKSNEYWMREPRFANFQRGSKEARRQAVTDLVREHASSPFGIVGFAGNVAEWVTFEPGGRRVAGTMGGSFRYPYTNDVNNPRLDREPRMSSSDAGIRVLWPAQAKTP